MGEEGTQAAAATVVDLDPTDEPSEAKVVILNRPFLFLIREQATNAIFFAGIYRSPSA